MTHKENITAILESYFIGFREDIIESACNRILEQESETGHWIVHPKSIYAHLVCDKCLSNAPYDCRTNYCPNCGAKMESEGENETYN